MFHMRKVKIGESICVLVLLFSGLVTCSGVFGSPLTDDVVTLGTLSENIPSDYRVPVNFISKDVGGACWLHLNLYPVESSLKTLAFKFGNLSTNRANITLFITMLQGFRFTLDNEELEVTMQTFKCHYRRVKWPTRRYFAHVKEVLIAAGPTLGEIHHCTPPPCRTPAAAPFTPGKHKQQNGMNGAIHGLLALLIIPSMAVLVLTVKMVFRRGGCCSQRRPEMTPGLHEPHDEAAESSHGPQRGDVQLLREPLDAAARGGPVSSSHSQQDRVWLDSLDCADTEV
ncbi:kit ligand b [Triplophysa rosa]|nr:kit ligand b [Triplophysa rosa]